MTGAGAHLSQQCCTCNKLCALYKIEIKIDVFSIIENTSEKRQQEFSNSYILVCVLFYTGFESFFLVNFNNVPNVS